MTNDKPASDASDSGHSGDSIKTAAAALYAEGRERERRHDYPGARDCYERSLALREDEAVRAAYLNVLSAIGPA